MMSRIDNIAKFAQQRDIKKMEKETQKQLRIERYKAEIRALKPRIDELLTVGNACVQHNIPIDAMSGYYGYDNHQFVSEGIRHLVGFIRERDQNTRAVLPFTKVGKIGGGACDWNLKTDGENIIVDGDIEYVLKAFLDKFDEFETEFYKYVDKVTGQ